MWLRGLLACLAAMVLAAPASAFDRQFPPAARRGTLTPAAYPEVVIDGSLRRLAPGARIWNEKNLIVLPASLRGSAPVNYTEDASRQIDRIWMLSADEARRPPQDQPTSQSQ